MKKVVVLDHTFSLPRRATKLAGSNSKYDELISATATAAADDATVAQFVATLRGFGSAIVHPTDGCHWIECE